MGFLEYLKRRVSTTHRLQCWHRAYLLVVCCICTFGHLGHEGNTLNTALPSHSPVYGCMGFPTACRPVRCSRPPWRNHALCIGAFSWSPALIFESPSVWEGIIRRCSYRLASVSGPDIHMPGDSVAAAKAVSAPLYTASWSAARDAAELSAASAPANRGARASCAGACTRGRASQTDSAALARTSARCSLRCRATRE